MQLPSPNAERFGEIMQDFQPCFSVGLFLQSLEGRHLGVPSSAASHQHQAALRGHLVTLGETKKKKRRGGDRLFIWDGNGAGERTDVFSFALRLENSRKPLLEEKAHGHQCDSCSLCRLEVSLEAEFCGG